MKTFYIITFSDSHWTYEFTKNLGKRKKYIVSKLSAFPPVRDDFMNGYNCFSSSHYCCNKRNLNRFIRKHLKEFRMDEYKWYKTKNGNLECNIIFSKI